MDKWHLAEFAFGKAQSIWLRDNAYSQGQAARLRILARDVSLVAKPQANTSIQNILPCRVEAIIEDSHEALALVKVMVGSTPLLSRMTRRSVAQLGLEQGKPMWAQIKSAALV